MGVGTSSWVCNKLNAGHLLYIVVIEDWSSVNFLSEALT